MRIILVITGLGMGGAENQVVNLADKFASKDHQVTIGYILQPALVQPKNADVNLVWLGGTKNPIGMLKALMNLVCLIKRTKPDVVHSHMFHANIMARMTRIFVHIPRLISTAHNTNEGGRIRMLTYRATNFLADVFTNVSKDAVNAFENKQAVRKGEMLAIINGIDIGYFKFNSTSRLELRSQLRLEEKNVFIAIGRFHEQKDYPNLLDAFEKIVQANNEVHLLIVGDGDLRAEIEQKIEKLNIRNNISLLGVRRDIPELLSAADIFVLPSAWEGFGLVVAEAMACERIVIGTDSGGVANVIGDAGYLVPARDSNALSNAMRNVLQLTDIEAKKLGGNARKRVEDHFSLEGIISRWLEIYQR